MFSLKKYFKKYIWLFLLCLAFLTGEALCDLLQPRFMANIVDDGIARNDMSAVFRLGGFMLLIAGVGAVCALSRNYLASTVSQKFASALRSDLFQKIIHLSLSDIDRFDRGSLITRLTNDVTQIQQFANGLMRIFFKAPVMCIGSIVMMITLYPSVSTVILVMVPVILFLIYLSIKIGYRYFYRVQLAVDRMNSVVREFLSGIRVVRAFHNVSAEKKRFLAANEEMADSQTKAMQVMAFFSPAIALTVNLSIVAILWLSGFRFQAVEVGKVMAAVNYMTQMLHAFGMISNIFNIFVRANASYTRIQEVLTTGDAICANQKDAVFSIEKGGIAFQNVSFSYHKKAQRKALDHISFTANPGETIGIIGSTGSGKTTLANLMMGFYQPDEGDIRIGGQSQKEISQRLLRENISFVPQKNLLFTGTIAENIRWGKENASEEGLKTAARIACADSFIEKQPRGYGTMIGQGGVNLSGGQKQRLAIARAVIRNTDILILDDCTSAVDANTEKKIRRSIREYQKDAIRFIISQRIISVMNADKILVLHDGKIAGQGTHANLLASCEIYQAIYHSQI